MAEQDISKTAKNSRPKAQQEIPFSSNEIRLSGGKWLIVLAISVLLSCLIPAGWQWVERFEPGEDYRIPYQLGNDYWLYSRYCRAMASQDKALVIGDSVVWGHYVSRDNTLSHYLNEITGGDTFANMGIDGIHPVALAGLLRYYGRDIAGKNVILIFNPLWMGSQKHDLQTTKEFSFNHPKLAPQFVPKIPCYAESCSNRLSAVVERYVPFLSWSQHLKITCFESMDLPGWTLEQPYRNPLKAVTFELPVSENSTEDDHTPWNQRGIRKQDFPWVEPETSFQWKFFQRSVEMLRARGNRVFVVVGPFNEHMLKGKSIETYQKMKSEIKAWLQQKNIACYIPPALPSEYYADASHPLSRGYAMLAKQLIEFEGFRLNVLNTVSD